MKEVTIPNVVLAEYITQSFKTLVAKVYLSMPMTNL